MIVVDANLLRDVGATTIALVGAIAWLKLMDTLADRGTIEQTLSRKIIHIGTGPLFVLCWPLFSASPWARGWAALVPLTITAKFVAIGVGWLADPAAVKSMTRHNDPREILKGPLFYGLMFVVCTVIFWRNSPVGLLALMMMCGGDGLADIIGRRFGTQKLPFSPAKSWAGSAAMLMGSYLFGLAVLMLFNTFGSFEPALAFGQTAVRVGIIAIAATVVEALPIPDIDNITLTVTVLILGQILLVG